MALRSFTSNPPATAGTRASGARDEVLDPYSDNTTAETQLSDDNIYDDDGASSGLLTLTALGSGVSDGYAATLTVGVDSSS